MPLLLSTELSVPTSSLPRGAAAVEQLHMLATSMCYALEQLGQQGAFTSGDWAALLAEETLGAGPSKGPWIPVALP